MLIVCECGTLARRTNGHDNIYPILDLSLYELNITLFIK